MRGQFTHWLTMVSCQADSFSCEVQVMALTASLAILTSHCPAISPPPLSSSFLVFYCHLSISPIHLWTFLLPLWPHPHCLFPSLPGMCFRKQTIPVTLSLSHCPSVCLSVCLSLSTYMFALRCCYCAKHGSGMGSIGYRILQSAFLFD